MKIRKRIWLLLYGMAILSIALVACTPGGEPPYDGTATLTETLEPTTSHTPESEISPPAEETHLPDSPPPESTADTADTADTVDFAEDTRNESTNDTAADTEPETESSADVELPKIDF